MGGVLRIDEITKQLGLEIKDLQTDRLGIAV